MKKFNIIFVTFGIIVFVACLFIVLSPKKQAPQPVAPQPTTYPLGLVTPLPSSLANNQKEVQYSVSALTLSVPTSLPVYSATDQSITNQKDAIAQGFGFTGGGAPLPAEVGGFRWSSGASILKMLLDPPSLSLSGIKMPTKNPTSDVGVVQLGKNLLSVAGITESVIEIVPGAVQHTTVEENGLTTSGAPIRLAVVTYYYQINGYPVYLAGGAALQSTVRIEADGAVRSAELIYPPAVASLGEKPVVPLSSAIDLLQNNRGSFVGVNASGTDNYVVNPSFNAASITNVFLGYVYLRPQKILRPVYVFTGATSLDNGRSAVATVVYFVPATN